MGQVLKMQEHGAPAAAKRAAKRRAYIDSLSSDQRQKLTRQVEDHAEAIEKLAHRLAEKNAEMRRVAQDIDGLISELKSLDPQLGEYPPEDLTYEQACAKAIAQIKRTPDDDLKADYMVKSVLAAGFKSGEIDVFTSKQWASLKAPLSPGLIAAVIEKTLATVNRLQHRAQDERRQRWPELLRRNDELLAAGIEGDRRRKSLADEFHLGVESIDKILGKARKHLGIPAKGRQGKKSS